MSKIRRSIVMLASAMALSTGALVVTTHAADQAGPSAAAASVAPQAAVPARAASDAVAASPTPPQTAPTPSAANPVATKPPAAKPPAPGAPQVPEESATIRDDPTIAPDPKQSADHSVSFPNDT
jgi:hypothetical protein